VTQLALDDLGTDNYKCVLTVTDVFGQSVEASCESENYAPVDPDQGQNTPTPQQPSSPVPSEPEVEEPKEEGLSPIVIIAVVLSVFVGVAVVIAVVIAAVAVAAVILKKRKKK
jgi:hypothetical protein